MRENHDSARPALGTDPLPRRFQDIPPKDPVIQDLEPELRLQLGLTAQFPSPQGDFQGQTGLRFKPFFRNGTSAQAGFPPLMKTRSKSCPLAPRGLTAAALLWAGPTPGRNGQAGDGFPTPPWVRATGCPTRSAGLPGSPAVLWIHAASNHPGRPGATLLLSPGAGGRLPHQLGGSPPPRFILTRPNRVRWRCGLHPVPVT